MSRHKIERDIRKLAESLIGTYCTKHGLDSLALDELTESEENEHRSELNALHSRACDQVMGEIELQEGR